MEYLIDLRFEDKNYDAMVHFVATFQVTDEKEAKTFIDELISAFVRNEVIIFPSRYYRIDNDPVLHQRSYQYYNFCLSIATATIKIEQFVLKNPDQTKTLANNLTERLFNGDISSANIGNKYKIPVRVLEKQSRNPITSDIYYFSIEHLVSKE